MEENRDDYLKKKLHIKDRFIRRLETEKRQLEIDNNSLQLRLKNVEYQLSNLIRTQRANDWKGMVDNSKQKQESTRIDTIPQSMNGSILAPRYIPFPNFRTSSLEEIEQDLHQTSAVSQDNENTKLLNENLEFNLEISYLKARLKSSETAKAVAERKIENLEEKLKLVETQKGQSLDTSSARAKSPCSSQNSRTDLTHCLDKILKGVLALDDKVSRWKINQ